MIELFLVNIKYRILCLGAFCILTINLVNAQYYWPPEKYSNLGINMNNTSFYICSHEYPRFPEEIDGPLEYNRLEGKFFLNDSIYKLNVGLKKSSSCYNDVPTYIVDKTSKWLMYNYHSSSRMNLTQEKDEVKDLAIALDSMDYFARMDKAEFKTYLLNVFFGIDKGTTFIPISIYDSVNLETFIFLYSTTQIRTVLFPEFGLRASCNRSTPISELSSHFIKHKFEISKTKIEISLEIKEKEKCGIYILYKNGTSSYNSITKKSIEFKYNPKEITAIVLDFNHRETFSIL